LSIATSNLTVLDHIIILVASLTDFEKDFTGRHGVELTKGGAHPHLGTANLLADLGNGAYLEVLGPNPAVVPPTGLGEMLAQRTAPQVASFALQTRHMDAVKTSAEAGGLEFLGPSAGSRRTSDGQLLQWHGAYIRGHRFGDFVPFFIDWGETRHPSETSVSGLELVEFTVMHPDADALAKVYQAIAADIQVVSGDEPGFKLRIRTPRGEFSLESYPDEPLFSAVPP